MKDIPTAFSPLGESSCSHKKKKALLEGDSSTLTSGATGQTMQKS